jgi:hypothetical protein
VVALGVRREAEDGAELAARRVTCGQKVKGRGYDTANRLHFRHISFG